MASIMGQKYHKANKMGQIQLGGGHKVGDRWRKAPPPPFSLSIMSDILV